ncbi:MAG: acyl transferase [Saprospiraceae bacterium]
MEDQSPLQSDNTINQYSQSRKLLIDGLIHSYEPLTDFDDKTYIIDLFRFQFEYNPIYRQFCQRLGVDVSQIQEIESIPMLPISAFKHHVIKTGQWQHQIIFKSSGTQQVGRSLHHVRDVQFYLNHAKYLWEKQFGRLDQFCFLALLPGYVDRGDSSLVTMVKYFVNVTKDNGSDFVLGKEDQIHRLVDKAQNQGHKIVLFGVSFALLNLLETARLKHPEMMFVETGGMKGLRTEMTKSELINTLKVGFNSQNVFSEYGMTELFSQVYTTGGIDFLKHKYLNIRIKQLQDPLSEEVKGKQGIIGCIDLANIDSCAFILTEDTGMLGENGYLNITGRMDDADIRGCNLMLSEEMIEPRKHQI